jgi:hypothetical protein
LVRCRVEESLLEKPERAVIGVAESPARLDDLVENRLEPRRAGNGAKDAADRLLLRAGVLELTSKLRGVGGRAGHSRSLSRLRSSGRAQTNAPTTRPAGR